MRNGPLQSNGVVKPDPGSHQKGGLEREKAGMSEWKEAAYRPNGALSPNPRSRREKGGLEHEGWPSPVKRSREIREGRDERVERSGPIDQTGP